MYLHLITVHNGPDMLLEEAAKEGLFRHATTHRILWSTHFPTAVRVLRKEKKES